MRLQNRLDMRDFPSASCYYLPKICRRVPTQARVGYPHGQILSFNRAGRDKALKHER